ncbi:MAG: hypothetical protein N2322_03940, partial [Terrimicrobiaceae bacterium]|nr:hypothetical protein [Terrimicrobiaceae bacterium]
ETMGAQCDMKGTAFHPTKDLEKPAPPQSVSQSRLFGLFSPCAPPIQPMRLRHSKRRRSNLKTLINRKTELDWRRKESRVFLRHDNSRPSI